MFYCCLAAHLHVYSELVRWLWAKLLRQELAASIAFRNGAPVRRQKEKDGFSGMSRAEAFTLPERWGGRNCLLPLRPDQVDVVKEIMEAMGGEELIQFNSKEYRIRAQQAYDTLTISKLSFQNVWHVFRAMRDLL